MYKRRKMLKIIASPTGLAPFPLFSIDQGKSRKSTRR
jgi:hypothetical protein